MKDNEITYLIIGLFRKVYKELGSGFLEKVYENAMEFEFKKNKLKYKRQFPIKIYYQNNIMGEYIADFVVEDRIIVELKAKPFLTKIEESQLLNYLNSSDKEIGLLLNFGNEREVKRKIFHNKYKKYKNYKK
jgi:GxxExxY protein